MINVKYKLLVGGLIGAVLVAAVGYKYFEWSTLSSLASQYNNSWKEELKQSSTMNSSFNEYTKITNSENLLEDPEESKKLISTTRLLIDQNQEYLNILEKNRKVYAQLLTKSKYIFGNKGTSIKEISRYQLNYYDIEIKRTKTSLVALHLVTNFYNIGQDAIKMKSFEDNAQGDETYYANNLDQISTLKKYSDESFAFTEQKGIIDNFPKAYDALEKFKAFYSTYYSVMEDFAKGNRESAIYKATKLQTDAAELNFDFEDILKEYQDGEKENAKNIITSIIHQSKLIKNLEESNTLKYPILPKIALYEEDVVLCQAYGYKTIALYRELLNDYPKAKRVSDLLVELNKITPKTDELDEKFDKKSMTLVNNDEKISFDCSDSKGNTYKFQSEKYETK